MGCAASVELQNQLWAAVFQSDAAACRKSLGVGASPDIRNGEGETALHIGVRVFNSEVFRLLVEAAHDTEIRDAHGQARRRLGVVPVIAAARPVVAFLLAPPRAAAEDRPLTPHLSQPLSRATAPRGADPAPPRCAGEPGGCSLADGARR